MSEQSALSPIRTAEIDIKPIFGWLVTPFATLRIRAGKKGSFVTFRSNCESLNQTTRRTNRVALFHPDKKQNEQTRQTLPEAIATGEDREFFTGWLIYVFFPFFKDCAEHVLCLVGLVGVPLL